MQIGEEQLSQPSQEETASEKSWALLGIGIGVFMSSLDTYIVNIALPTLMESLNTKFATIQWVVLSYLLTFTVLLLGAGRLGDMLGKKPLYLVGMLLFTISSLLCGLAPNVGFLIGFRVLQGLGAVFSLGLGFGIITEIFPPQERGRALGTMSGISAVAIALGPTVGGLLIGFFDWRLIFFVNVPIGLVATWVVAKVVPDSLSSGASKSFDWIGALLMTLTLLCFSLYMIEGQQQGFGSTTVLMLLGIAAIALAGFLLVEARIEEPLLDLKIFHSLNFSLNLLLNLIVYALNVAVYFILPFFLELVKQYPAQQAGLLVAVIPIVYGLVSPLAGTVSDRFGTRSIILIGLVLMTFGCLAMGTFDAQLSVLGYILRVVPWAMGLGMFLPPNNSATMGAAPKEHLGIASGLASLSRMLGQVTGVPLLGAVFSTLTLARTQPTDISIIDVTNAPVEALVFGVQTTFRIAALLVMILIIVAVILWKLEKTKALAASAAWHQ